MRREHIIIIEAETKKQALEKHIKHSFDAIEIYTQQTAVCCDDLIAFARKEAEEEGKEK